MPDLIGASFSAPLGASCFLIGAGMITVYVDVSRCWSFRFQGLRQGEYRLKGNSNDTSGAKHNGRKDGSPKPARTAAGTKLTMVGVTTAF